MNTALRRFRDTILNEALRELRPRDLAFYAIALVMFVGVSLILPYNTQVYLSVVAGMTIALLLLMSIARSEFTRNVALVGGASLLSIALIPKGILSLLSPVQDIFLDIQHLSRILSVALTALYVALGVLQFAHVRPRGVIMRRVSRFLSVCNTAISSELCTCLHPIPFIDVILIPLGVADLLVNRVKLGFVIMMMTLVFQIRTSYGFHKASPNR